MPVRRQTRLSRATLPILHFPGVASPAMSSLAPPLLSGHAVPGMTTLRRFVLVAALVAGGAMIGLLSRHAFSVAFWPANAVLVGAMLRKPSLFRLSGWAGAFVGFVTTDLVFDRNIELSAFFALANTAGTLTATLALRRLDPADLRLERVHSVLRILAGLIPGCCVAALIGAVLVVVEFHGSAAQTLLTWPASELVNYLVVLPVLLTLRHPDAQPPRIAEPPLWPAGVLALSCVAAVQFDGPGSIMFPMPALLLCALTYPVAITAVLTMLLGAGCLVTIGLGMVAIGQDMAIPRLVLSVRIAVAFLVLVPLTISSAMAVQDALLRQLRDAADHDGLTGLLNRRAFEARLQERLAQHLPPGGGLALLWLDLDHFKAINDRHGHPAGDAVLRAVADTLRGVCGPGELCGRLGGEEFALLLSAPDCAAAHQAAERLRAAIVAQKVDWAGTMIHATASIGACHLTRLPTDAAPLLRRLDEAMYRAKRGGRNRIEWLDAPGAARAA